MYKPTSFSSHHRYLPIHYSKSTQPTEPIHDLNSEKLIMSPISSSLEYFHAHLSLSTSTHNFTKFSPSFHPHCCSEIHFSFYCKTCKLRLARCEQPTVRKHRAGKTQKPPPEHADHQHARTPSPQCSQNQGAPTPLEYQCKRLAGHSSQPGRGLKLPSEGRVAKEEGEAALEGSMTSRDNIGAPLTRLSKKEKKKNQINKRKKKRKRK